MWQKTQQDFFLKKLAGLRTYCDILAYCLMADHFHLLVYLKTRQAYPVTALYAQNECLKFDNSDQPFNLRTSSDPKNKDSMNFAHNNFYHIYNRSFNKTALFYRPGNYTFFLKKLAGLRTYCDILAYCLMPDHFHLLVYVPEDSAGCTRQTGMQALARKIGTILSSYTQAINKQQSRSGSLFQPKSKAKELDKVDQPFICFNYIHQNPLRKGLVKKIENWEYCSFNEYFQFNNILCNTQLAGNCLIYLAIRICFTSSLTVL